MNLNQFNLIVLNLYIIFYNQLNLYGYIIYNIWLLIPSDGRFSFPLACKLEISSIETKVIPGATANILLYIRIKN